ncbi:MAG: HAD family hydrolase [Treponema sp.]|nr:HAD family hydrolase [Treponema sp.]
MQVKNLGEIEAVAFDIDGTLYDQWRIHFYAIWHYISHGVFFLHFGLTRHEMHGMEPLEDFRKIQAEKMARRMNCTYDKAFSKLEKVVYNGLKRYFVKMPCIKDVPETFKKFKEAGLKIALLSDFPPEQKGEIWGLKPYCDAILGTEALGALKPDVHSFLRMSEIIGVAPEKILYVGNSKKYDVIGSKRAGMKSAYLLTGFKRFFNIKDKDADISFCNYRQLQDIVLN